MSRANLLIKLAPQVRLELTTLRLTAECSAIELLWNINFSIRRLSIFVRYLSVSVAIWRFRQETNRFYTKISLIVQW